jgi:hypothetical protein
MFGWFRSKPECPVDPAMREWIDTRWAWLEVQFGPERLRTARVVLPRPEFFPDPFRGTEEDARRMVDRVCEYMDIDPATVELSLYQDRNPVNDGKWRGTAGLYHPEGDKFRIWVEVANLNDPLAMVATIAHELGHVHLLGHGRISDQAEDHEPVTDLLTVYFGMGVFTANSVIREHYWDLGQVSGWSMGRRGYLGMPAYGYAFARFARGRSEDGTEWASELRLDVRSAFNQAMRFLEVEDRCEWNIQPDPSHMTGFARHDGVAAAPADRLGGSTAENPMDEEQFWDIVARACRSNPRTAGEWGQWLQAELKCLEPAKIIEWNHIFDRLAARAYTVDLWGAAYIINGAAYDDEFYNFRCWLIGMGQDVYEDAVANPDSLADVVVPGFDAEAEIYAAAHVAWMAVTGRLDTDPYPARKERAELRGEDWEFDDDEELRRRLPRLAAMYLD